MARSASHAIDDMLDEIAWVTAALSGKTFAQFEAERTTRYAVERSIEILSEASRRLGPDLTTRHPEIPWRAIAAMGNILRHEYHATSAKIVWNVVRNDLPPLRAALDELRRQLDADPTWV